MYIYNLTQKEVVGLNKENAKPETKKEGTKGKKKKKKKMPKGLRVFLILFLMVFITGVLSVSLVVLEVFTDVGLINIGASNPENDVAGVDYIDLDQYLKDQSQTTIIYAGERDNDPVEIARLHGAENREWVDLEYVCEDLKNAVVDLEDKRFYEHQGVDWIRTIGVVVEYSFSQGGSTITQQLIKNLTGENNRTFVRKYKEIRNALALEQHFEKDEILEAYLNTIYLDMGCYGIKTGAEYYFNKTVDELTLMESAILASITNAPRKYNPIINYDINRDRATQCLDAMLAQGHITQAEYDAALAEDVQFYGDTRNTIENEDGEEVEVEVETEYNSYYVDFIIDSLIEDLQKKYGYTESEAFHKVYYGGLKVYGALDLEIQDELEYVYENRVTFPQEEDTEDNPAIQSSMIIMDYEGRVVATAGRLGKKVGDRTLNIGTSSPRQPGSCIKPLSAYAPAIELGVFYWSSYLPNFGINLPGESRAWPTNYGGVTGDPNDLRNLPQAIAPSLNTVPARIIDTISTETSYTFLRDRFHISTLTEIDNNYAPLAIGAMQYGMTCLEMAAAFVTFGSGGIYYEPWCYYEVTNSAGTEVILEPDREGERVLTKGTADVMLQMLKCVVSYSGGTGAPYAVKGQSNWAKTGTSSDNVDRWIIGGTPYYLGCVWTGFEKERRTINLGYYGANPAGQVYREVMKRIHEGLEYKDFEMSDESVQRSYCTATGRLANSGCPTATGWFRVDALPSVCSGHRSSGGSGGGSTEIPQF